MRPGHGWVSDARAVTLARCLDLTPLREDASVREWAADSEWGQWACLFFRCSPSGNVPSAGVPLVCACCAICYVADVSILLAMSSRPCVCKIPRLRPLSYGPGKKFELCPVFRYLPLVCCVEDADLLLWSMSYIHHAYDVILANVPLMDGSLSAARA